VPCATFIGGKQGFAFKPVPCTRGVVGTPVSAILMAGLQASAKVMVPSSFRS
jgi:hypothetical protein